MNLKESEKSKFHSSWWNKISSEFDKDYMKNVYQYLISRKIDFTDIYPSSDKIYKAFEYPFNDIKVVIIGQDPYHTKGMAQGLAFSVPVNTDKIPPSLKNIFREIEEDIYGGLYLDNNPDLSRWSKQGVFLLNTCLTVEEGNPLSHNNIGWEHFTAKAIELINNKNTSVVFMLWGNHAKQYKPLITNKNHLILEAEYPLTFESFVGCKHFSKTNEFLRTNNIQQITW